MEEGINFSSITSRDELNTEILRTLPVSPIYAGLFFSESSVSEKDYEKECTERGIIPYSRIGFGYDSSFKLFSVLELITAKHKKFDFVPLMIKKSKFHRISFEFSNNHEQFPQFVSNILPELIKENYTLERGNILLSYIDTAHMDESSSDVGIQLNLGLNKEPKLIVKQPLSDKGKLKEATMKLWLSNILENYR